MSWWDRAVPGKNDLKNWRRVEGELQHRDACLASGHYSPTDEEARPKAVPLAEITGKKKKPCDHRRCYWERPCERCRAKMVEEALGGLK